MLLGKFSMVGYGCLASELLSLYFFYYVFLRDILFIAPAYYRTHCVCFLSLCALLWGASLERGFRYKFWRTVVRDRLWEQLCGAALGNRSSFARQLCTEALKNSFRMQLWGAAFGSNFAEQFSGAALENSFGAPLFGTGLNDSRF